MELLLTLGLLEVPGLLITHNYLDWHRVSGLLVENTKGPVAQVVLRPWELLQMIVYLCCYRSFSIAQILVLLMVALVRADN